MFRLISAALATCLLCGACADDAPPAAPETVLTDYLQALHAGRFTDAATHCTPAAVAYLDALRAVIAATEEAPDSSGIHVESIQCTVQADTTARCTAVLDDGFEPSTDRYELRRRDRRWWVHHAPDDGQTTTSEEPLQD